MSSGTSTREQGFQVSHFFVLLSLIAATVAVMLARPNTPENLVAMSLAIGAAGVAAVGFYRMIAPLVAAPTDALREPIGAGLRADLEREKSLTLRSIKELEFDHAMGKLSREDFEQMAGRLRARAMGIMRQLDAGTQIYRQQIEQELAARIAPAAPRVGAGAKPAAACACGTVNDRDARFCKSCGTKLTEGPE